MKSSGMGNELEKLALRGNDVDAGLGSESFRSAAKLVHSSGGVQVALRIDAPAVRASARIEVVVDPHVANPSVGAEIIRADHAGAAFRAVRFDQIQPLVIRRDLNP